VERLNSSMREFATHCGHKRQYATEGTAQSALEVLNEMKRKGKAKMYPKGRGMVTEVYQCENCGFWHIGHTRKEWAKRSEIDEHVEEERDTD